jgi:hypothetical protein
LAADRVLDLDLDFFVWPPAHWPQWKGRMPPDAVERLASPEAVRGFLEGQCGLSREKPLPGTMVTKHDEVFPVWRRWLDDGLLRGPFEVVHVDGHADLGLGDAGYVYLMTELLAAPVQERRNPRTGFDGMNEGNYLTFALANRWLARLTYVFTDEPADIAAKREEDFRRWQRATGNTSPHVATDEGGDLMVYHFYRMDPRTGLLELKYYADWSKFDWGRVRPGVSWPEPTACEPQVPFNAVPGSQYRGEGFTQIVVAHSPQFTPEAADTLLPVIMEYVRVPT